MTLEELKDIIEREGNRVVKEMRATASIPTPDGSVTVEVEPTIEVSFRRMSDGREVLSRLIAPGGVVEYVTGEALVRALAHGRYETEKAEKRVRDIVETVAYLVERIPECKGNQSYAPTVLCKHGDYALLFEGCHVGYRLNGVFKIIHGATEYEFYPTFIGLKALKRIIERGCRGLDRLVERYKEREKSPLGTLVMTSWW